MTFIARDYRQGAAKKYITLGGVEFLRRFARHILPRRFVKIRRYGIYNHTVKRNRGIKFRVEDESESDNKSKSQKQQGRICHLVKNKRSQNLLLSLIHPKNLYRKAQKPAKCKRSLAYFSFRKNKNLR